jgi:hypothetical protein
MFRGKRSDPLHERYGSSRKRSRRRGRTLETYELARRHDEILAPDHFALTRKSSAISIHTSM